MSTYIDDEIESNNFEEDTVEVEVTSRDNESLLITETRFGWDRVMEINLQTKLMYLWNQWFRDCGTQTNYCHLKQILRENWTSMVNEGCKTV